MSSKEEWRDIVGYEGRYQVSNLGRVRSLPSFDSLGRNINGKILSPVNESNGYAQVTLCNKAGHRGVSVHRLVAVAFLENPNSFPDINHIDENKKNNRVENLEWCSKSYNINYGTRNFRCAIATNKPVFAILDTGHHYYFRSGAYASKITGISKSSINNNLRGRSKTCAGGIRFTYA